jgi:hypothetical protein
MDHLRRNETAGRTGGLDLCEIAKSLIDNRSDKRFVADAAHCAGGVAVSALRRKVGHGNDRVWKAWKAIMPASHPSHTLWKSLWDSHIPTASTTGYMSSRAP